MRSRLVVSACVLASAAIGCARPDRAVSSPLQPAPTNAVVVEPAVTAAAAVPNGWPSAGGTDHAAPAEPRRGPDQRRSKPTRDRAKPTPDEGRCVTPTPTVTGDPQPDLQLRISGPKTMALTDLPTIEATLKNSSRRAHSIVTPGDGSDAGWRDPVITFSAFIDEGDGCWRPLPRAVVGRCGLFDHVWQDEIVRLGPGKTQALGPLWAHPFFEWRKGTVRLFVHYAWTGGAASKGSATTSVDLAGMAKEAPYELVSPALEIVVTG